MSQRPGWYPDPAGVEGRFRYWDGAGWSSAVTFNPDGKPPTTPGDSSGASAPGRLSRRGATILGVVAGAVLLGLITVLAITIPPMMQPRPPDESPGSSVVRPSGSVTPNAPPSAELNCAGANGVSLGSRAPEYSSTGVTVTVPADWGFRFSREQWTWLDDAALWGKRVGTGKDGRYVGMFLGGVAARNGFRTPEQAVGEIVTCLTRYGPYNDRTYPMVEVSSAAVTVGGMPGWQRVIEIDEAPDGPKARLTILVLDSGQPARLATLTTLAPADDQSAVAAADQVAASLRKQ